MATDTPAQETSGRDQWLAERRTMITASDVAQIAGLSKWGGPLAVYLDKIGQPVEMVETEAMEAGNRMQIPILEWYSAREKVPIVLEAPYRVRRSEAVPLIGASLDALRATGEPVDAKNVRFQTSEWGDEGTDEIPLYYATQLVFQMHVTGASFADLAVLFSGQDLRVFRLHRVKETEENLIAEAERFWKAFVEPRIPPPVDASPAWSAYLKRAFRQTSEVMVEATAEHHAAAMQIVDAKRELDKWDEIKVGAENYLKAAIAEGKGITGTNWRAVWSAVKDSKGTDWEAVARGLARQISEVTGSETEEVLADIVPENQKVLRVGGRRFTLKVEEMK